MLKTHLSLLESSVRIFQILFHTLITSFPKEVCRKKYQKNYFINTLFLYLIYNFVLTKEFLEINKN